MRARSVVELKAGVCHGDRIRARRLARPHALCRGTSAAVPKWALGTQIARATTSFLPPACRPPCVDHRCFASSGRDVPQPPTQVAAVRAHEQDVAHFNGTACFAISRS